MIGDLKMLFRYDDYDMRLNVLVCVEREGVITHVAKPVELTLEERDPFTPIEPTMQIDTPQNVASIIKSIQEELPRIGHKPTPQAQIEGELTATKSHLNDLRTMMGLDDEQCQRELSVSKR